MLMLVLGADLLADTAESWFADVISEPDFLPGCAEVLLGLEHPALIWGGGTGIQNNDDSWLVLGFGTAPLILEGTREYPEENTWIKANNDALDALAETVWGIRISAHESVEIQSHRTATDSRIMERFQSMSVTEREGFLAGSWEIGRWKLGHEANTVGVLRIVASPGHPISQLTGRIPVVSDTLDPAWREHVLTRPTLRYGGATAVQHQGKTWLLISGVSHVEKGIAAVPSKKIDEAEERARKEWIRFVQGTTKLKSHTGFALEMIRFQADVGLAAEDIRERIIENRITITNSESEEHGFIPVGLWLSDAGDTYRLAVVYRRTPDGSIPTSDLGYRMSRPVIPK